MCCSWSRAHACTCRYDCDHIDRDGEHSIQRYGRWKLSTAPTALCAWTEASGRTRLATAGHDGSVEVWHAKAFEDVASRHYIAGADLLNGNHARDFSMAQLHSDWITQLGFTASIHSGGLLSAYAPARLLAISRVHACPRAAYDLLPRACMPTCRL